VTQASIVSVVPSPQIIPFHSIVADKRGGSKQTSLYDIFHEQRWVQREEREKKYLQTNALRERT